MMMIFLTAIITYIIVTQTSSSAISSRTVTVEEIGSQAKLNAESCVDEALERIRQNTSYSSSFTLNLTKGNCTASVSGSGSVKTIITSGSVGNTLRNIEVTTSALNPTIIVDSWQEL